jgi:transcriptional regulator with GAF, ATPase, and Fis domain
MTTDAFRSHAARAEINVTPLIDVLLALVVILIVAAPVALHRLPLPGDSHRSDSSHMTLALSILLLTPLLPASARPLELPEELAKRPSQVPRFEGAVREAIEETLRLTRGKIYGADGAAARLGLKPGTLQSKMKKLGIVRGAFVRS